MVAEVDDISNRRLSIENKIFQGDLLEDSISLVTNQEVATENDNVNHNDMENRPYR